MYVGTLVPYATSWGLGEASHSICRVCWLAAAEDLDAVDYMTKLNAKEHALVLCSTYSSNRQGLKQLLAYHSGRGFIFDTAALFNNRDATASRFEVCSSLR